MYTDFRPTPLQHYIYPAGGDGLFLVEDEKVQTEVVFLDLEFFATYGLVTLLKLSLVLGVRRSYGKVITMASICSKFVHCTSLIICNEHCGKGKF